jgi:hypothetical protein
MNAKVLPKMKYLIFKMLKTFCLFSALDEDEDESEKE